MFRLVKLLCSRISTSIPTHKYITLYTLLNTPLLSTRSPKKPKSRRQIVPTIIPLAGSQAFNASASGSTRPGGGGDSVSSAPVAGPSGLQNGLREGTREEPIALMSDGEDGGRGGSVGGVGAGGGTALKRKPSAESQAASTGGAKKRRRGADIVSFCPFCFEYLVEDVRTDSS